MDVEQELSRVLRSVEVPPASDPVADVRSGLRRRQLVRRAQAVTSALALVLLAVAASTLLDDPTPRRAPLPGSSLGPTAEPSSEPRPSPTSEPTPSQPAALLVGEGGSDLSWVSLDVGFALVSDPCGSSTCSQLLRTSDGGRTWSHVDAAGLPQACSTACPLRVRFADAEVGYVYGDGLVMTTDGGRTWTRQPGPDTHGLEVAHGNVLRVVERAACPGCAFDVQRSQVGSGTWERVYRSDEAVSAADLARQGDAVVVTLRGNPAGGAGSAQSTLLVTPDAGATWQRHTDPCHGTPDDEWDAWQQSWSLDGELVVLCQRRMARSNGGNAAIELSSDGGRTFSVPRGFGEVTDVFQLAAGRGVLLAETHFGIDREVLLQRSTDGGRTWTEVARAPLPDGAVTGYLAFSTSAVVTWVPPGGAAVWRSGDAGATWSSYPLSGAR